MVSEPSPSPGGTEAEVRAALDEVIHPSFGMSLIALGMVRAVRTTAEVIEVDLVMNCPGCPAGEVVLAMARQKLKALSLGTVRLNLLPQAWKPSSE
jgi:metal-sulfur cluster biosynthetic enzyme